MHALDYLSSAAHARSLLPAVIRLRSSEEHSAPPASLSATPEGHPSITVPVLAHRWYTVYPHLPCSDSRCATACSTALNGSHVSAPTRAACL